jgi:hypothetical protein
MYYQALKLKATTSESKVVRLIKKKEDREVKEESLNVFFIHAI